MKKLKIIYFLIASLLLAFCTTPSVADFKDDEKPLSAEEYITIWRFPRQGSFKESLITSEAHFEALEKNMTPLFEQFIPQILADARNGKIQIHEFIDPGSMERAPIEDLTARIQDVKHFGSTWQNIESFTQVFQITQRRKSDQLGFKAEELMLGIISVDPKGQKPERYLGVVPFSDIKSRNYQITFEGETYDPVSYMEKVAEYGYPIYYQNHEMANGLQSLEEAFETKKYVLEGRWKYLKWIGMSPNLTEYSFTPMSVNDLENYTGIYLFEPAENSWLFKSDIPKEVKITVSSDYLETEWPDKSPYFSYDIFSMADGRFFTATSDIVIFEQLDNGKMKCTITHKDGVVLTGVMQ